MFTIGKTKEIELNSITGTPLPIQSKLNSITGTPLPIQSKLNSFPTETRGNSNNNSKLSSYDTQVENNYSSDGEMTYLCFAPEKSTAVKYYCSSLMLTK